MGGLSFSGGHVCPIPANSQNPKLFEFLEQLGVAFTQTSKRQDLSLLLPLGERGTDANAMVGEGTMAWQSHGELVLSQRRNKK
jgi:hypothetical protein